MSMPITTTGESAACLRVLRAAGEPMTAAQIAAHLGLGGGRETQRRHVRAVVKVLRDRGERIVATLSGGYWLTDQEDVWRDYLEGRKIDAKRLIGEAGRRQRMAADAHGQGLLFVRL